MSRIAVDACHITVTSCQTCTFDFRLRGRSWRRAATFLPSGTVRSHNFFHRNIMTAMNDTIVNPETCLSLPLLPLLPLEDPTTARMNRKHKLRSKQAYVTETKKQKTGSEAETSPFGSLTSIPGVKLGSRYEPEVPMTKTELVQWRKQARRVRNRESAAASREKTRLKIEELEAALSESRRKYEAALKRIAELEKSCVQSLPIVDDPLPSIIYTTDIAPAVSPPLSPRESLILSFDDDDDDVHDLIRPMYQQSMISRPTAD
jgi:hypothetical protein